MKLTSKYFSIFFICFILFFSFDNSFSEGKSIGNIISSSNPLVLYDGFNINLKDKFRNKWIKRMNISSESFEDNYYDHLILYNTSDLEVVDKILDNYQVFHGDVIGLDNSLDFTFLELNFDETNKIYSILLISSDFSHDFE